MLKTLLEACLAIVQKLKSVQAELDAAKAALAAAEVEKAEAITLVEQLKAELEALSFTPSGQ